MKTVNQLKPEDNFDSGEPQTEFTPTLIGFYAASTAVGLFAAIAAVAFMVLPEFEGMEEVGQPIGILFSVLTVVAGVGCWVLLKRVREHRGDA